MAGGSERRRSMADYSVATHAQGTSAADGRLERYHKYVGRRRVERRVWPGAAFIVEALLLLVFLTGSLAVLMSLDAAADRAGEQSADLMGAIVLASNAAEQFAADPAAFEEAYAADPTADRWLSEPLDAVASGSNLLVISCDFSTEATGGGTLHYATISVWKERVLTDHGQARAEGILISSPDGVCFERWEDEPVYTLKTTSYVASSTEAAAAAAPAEGVATHG